LLILYLTNQATLPDAASPITIKLQADVKIFIFITTMSIHISAAKGEIAKTVLMPGDPLRAKFIADNFLKDTRQVSSTRNAFYFTGSYKNERITVGASGMGCPSIGIYSYELYTEYEVDRIIRIGTCGAYSPRLRLFDLLNVASAVSESTFALHAWGFKEASLPQQGNFFDAINATSARINVPVSAAVIHSSDIFYRKEEGIPAIASEHNCVAVEMESFALFANARHLNKTAATILTVSDIIPTHEKISADQREKSLLPMFKLALESCCDG
jgi:purine-nucleoside phosphorylase